jgi:hypothetical protein
MCRLWEPGSLREAWSLNDPLALGHDLQLTSTFEGLPRQERALAARVATATPLVATEQQREHACVSDPAVDAPHGAPPFVVGTTRPVL